MSDFQKVQNNIDQLLYSLNKYKEIIDEKIKKKDLLQRIESFKQNYSQFNKINRFCIPIIGACNSGKTTFINYLLGQNFLEMNSDITTKFICIIRHDPDLKTPIIYKVNLIERSKTKNNSLYNFEEGDKEEINTNITISEFIIKKNKEKKNISDKEYKDYFLIIKVNIPIFNDPEIAPYSNYFEFMDIPGLNDNSDNFYMKNLCPLFINNCKFCFFIFSSEDFQSKASKEIFNKILGLFQEPEKIKKYSIYILNKIDKVQNESEKNKLKTDLQKFINIKENNIISCNSKLLLLNQLKFTNFINYLDYIFCKPQDNNIEEIEDPNSYISSKLEEDLGKPIEENIIINDNDQTQNEYNIYIKKNFELEHFPIEENDFIKYKSHFDKNKEKIEEINNKDNQEIKKVENEIKLNIKNSFKQIFNSYMNFKQYDNIKEEIEKNLGIKLNTKKEIDENNPFKNKDLIQVFNSFGEIIKELNSLKKHDYIKIIDEDYKLIDTFLKKQIKIKIPFLGCCGSGKSSLLNNLIGYDLLPKGSNIIVINYTSDIENICLKKTFSKKNYNISEKYYYFQDDKNNIHSKLENMKEIISLLNEAYLYEDKFVNDIISLINIKNFKDKNIKENIDLLIDIIKYKKIDSLEKLKQNFNKPDFKDEIFKRILNYLDLIIKNRNNLLRKNENQENQEVPFLKLIIPIKTFNDFIELDEKDKYKIELIDIPGLNKEEENNSLIKKIKDSFVNYSDGIIYVTKISIIEKDNSEIIYDTILKIRKSKLLNFSFDNLLFVLTNYEQSPNFNMEEKIKDINNSINKENIIINHNIKDNKKFLISKFLNKKYEKYLKDYNIIENIDKFFDFIVKTEKSIPQTNDEYDDKIKKYFDKILLNKIKKKNDFMNYNPSIDLETIKGKKYTCNKEVKKRYLFFKENINNHIYLEQSNYKDLKANFYKFLENTKISFDKNIGRNVINFVKDLQEKLLNIKNKNNVVHIDITKIESIFSELKIDFEELINNFKSNFQNRLINLKNEIQKGTSRENEIISFTNKCNSEFNDLKNAIQILINEKTLQINGLNGRLFEENKYEKEYFFTKKHLVAHGAALVAQAGIDGLIIGLSSIAIPVIGVGIAISFVVIHSSKAIYDWINEKEQFIKKIEYYEKIYIENLEGYKKQISKIIEKAKKNNISQIKNKILANSLDLNEKQRTKFNEIYELFKRKIEDNFNFN